jgi:biopolymer transport protein ExbD
MTFNAWKKSGGYGHEINMTPLIDVSLVLVVMLLLATPLAFESSIGVRKDDSTAQSAESKDQQERIEIVVVSDGEVKVNRDLVQLADLNSILEPMLIEAVDRTVLIACEDGVTHGAFVNVLDQAKLSGATGIAVFER